MPGSSQKSKKIHLSSAYFTLCACHLSKRKILCHFLMVISFLLQAPNLRLANNRHFFVLPDMNCFIDYWMKQWLVNAVFAVSYGPQHVFLILQQAGILLRRIRLDAPSYFSRRCTLIRMRLSQKILCSWLHSIWSFHWVGHSKIVDYHFLCRQRRNLRRCC